MSKETGGQAFPKQQWEYDGQNKVLQYQEDGMTLRDYFAAKAMSNLIARIPFGEYVPERQVAIDAYDYADAMLAARVQ